MSSVSLDKETKLELIRLLIATEEGWKKLAESIRVCQDPVDARLQCLDLLKEIGKEQSIQLPSSFSDDLKTTASHSTTAKLMSVNLSDLLARHLDKHL